MNLSSKAKIFIIVAWALLLTLITVVVTLIVRPKSNIVNVKEYTDNPVAEYVSISGTLTESRTPSQSTSTRGESSTWTLKVRMFKPKKDVKVVAKYVQCMVRVETTSGEVIYKEDAKGSLKASGGSAMLNSSTYSDFSFSSIVSRKADNIEKLALTTDQTPKNIYITLYCVLQIGDTSEVKEETIKYKVEGLDLSNIKDTTSAKPESDVVDVEVEQESGEDHMHIHYSSDEVIDNSKYQVVAKVNNDPSDSKDLTPNYILLGTYFGAMPSGISLLTVSPSVNSAYDIQAVYVYGSCKTGENTYSVNYQTQIVQE